MQGLVMDHEVCVHNLMECGQVVIQYLPIQELTKIFITILATLSKSQKITGYIGINFIRDHLLLLHYLLAVHQAEDLLQ